MRILETKFHGTVHELRYFVEERKAVLINSDKHPLATMWGNNPFYSLSVLVLFAVIMFWTFIAIFIMGHNPVSRLYNRVY